MMQLQAIYLAETEKYFARTDLKISCSESL
jgi:hypothetical protein